MFKKVKDREFHQSFEIIFFKDSNGKLEKYYNPENKNSVGRFLTHMIYCQQVTC